MGTPPRSPERIDANGADITLLAPPLPVLDRPAAMALLELLQRAASKEHTDLHATRDEERARS